MTFYVWKVHLHSFQTTTFAKGHKKHHWNLQKMIGWQSNCIRCPQNTKNTKHNLRWLLCSSAILEATLLDSRHQKWCPMFCFRRTVLQTKLFLFTARTTQKLLAKMRGSLHSTGYSEREFILFADSPKGQKYFELYCLLCWAKYQSLTFHIQEIFLKKFWNMFFK